jgi:hypothetical protein
MLILGTEAWLRKFTPIQVNWMLPLPSLESAP